MLFPGERLLARINPELARKPRRRKTQSPRQIKNQRLGDSPRLKANSFMTVSASGRMRHDVSSARGSLSGDPDELSWQGCSQ